MVKINKKDVLSMVFAVLVAIVVGHAWAKRERDFREATQMSPCLVAKRYVGMGRVLEKNDVELKQIPLAYHEPGVLTGLLTLGQFKSRLGILPGEQITLSKLADPLSSVSLSWSLPKGKVALSVRLPYEHVVGAQIIVGDHVAIFGADPKLAMLLKRIHVLDVTPLVYQRDSQSALIQEPQDVLFTLALTLDEAAALCALQDKGPLYFALLPAYEVSLNFDRGSDLGGQSGVSLPRNFSGDTNHGKVVPLFGALDSYDFSGRSQNNWRLSRKTVCFEAMFISQRA